ncbi:hypothetical protein GX50_08367 [[Emmonsia] crescens]|uniref:Uncharacterized protein n=1 Tax=[Emmonsia] crescens TaxID=73230 RepID=A0A2B7Z6L0_9EURO|nr:hypothetical protein GX50_08367 [Emmonsia crescens]
MSSDSYSYGHEMNSIASGVYATLWTPRTIKSGPSAATRFQRILKRATQIPNRGMLSLLRCLKGIVDFDKRFVELKIAIDTTFCGDCAGDVWAITDGCTWHGMSCDDYVTNNPAVFNDSFWAVRYIKAFNRGY